MGGGASKPAQNLRNARENEADATKMFDSIDKDHDGKIDTGELHGPHTQCSALTTPCASPRC